jgi:hypothetical protein
MITFEHQWLLCFVLDNMLANTQRPDFLAFAVKVYSYAPTSPDQEGLVYYKSERDPKRNLQATTTNRD